MNNTETPVPSIEQGAEKIATMLAAIFVDAAKRGSDPVAYVNEALDVFEARWPLTAKAARETFAEMIRIEWE